VHSAIARPALARSISAALAVPGRQILLYGRSGSGKSTALFAELHRNENLRHVVIRCTSETSFSTMLQSAMNRFGLPDEKDESVALHYVAIELGRRGACVVIEDVHRLAQRERDRLFSAMKIFSDIGNQYPAVKIVAIAAVESPDALGVLDSEFSSRIAEIRVPEMTLAELESIVRAGGDLLNIDASHSAPFIAHRAGGMPGIAHQLALESFVDAGIFAKAAEREELPSSATIHAVVMRLSEMPHHVRSRFDAALESKLARGDVERVLDALSMFDPEGVFIDDLVEYVSSDGGGSRMSYIPGIVADLARDDRGAVVERLAHDRVRFSEPLLHSYWTMISQAIE
jgi:Cdc6-like AAA superfamily ATPase